MSRESRVEGRERRAFRFESIEAWQLARALNKKVYVLSRAFPKEEMFGLTSQLRRASVSVSSNVAEGSGRNSDTDFAHFLEIAYGSLMEVTSQLFLALDQGYIAEKDLDPILTEIDLLAAKIAALSKSLGRTSRLSPKPSTLDPRPSSPRHSTLDPRPSTK
jgi:four helix bundle protein